VIAARCLEARVGSFELRDVSFTVADGAYGVVIGPAGSGKTTLLEALAGVIPVSGGALQLKGRDVAGFAPEARDVALIYQQAFLFPHLSVRDNVAYGASDPALVEELLGRFAIADLPGRDVRSLSGGERQLVAIARALARRTSIVLLDEPYSSLDPRRRATTRREVRSLQRAWGFTALQVTHDFTEAGLLGDTAVLLDRGRVLQHGPPEEVFRKPATPYVAEFLGAENVFAGTARTLADVPPDYLVAPAEWSDTHHAIEFTTGGLTIYAVGNATNGACYAVIRAQDVVLSNTPQSSSARNTFLGTVTEVATTGAFARVAVDIAGVPLVAALTSRSVQELTLRPGIPVVASFKALAVHLC
jgi:molybdate/tungstate transport system ATP-binding protein